MRFLRRWRGQIVQVSRQLWCGSLRTHCSKECGLVQVRHTCQGWRMCAIMATQTGALRLRVIEGHCRPVGCNVATGTVISCLQMRLRFSSSWCVVAVVAAKAGGGSHNRIIVLECCASPAVEIGVAQLAIIRGCRMSREGRLSKCGRMCRCTIMAGEAVCCICCFRMVENCARERGCVVATFAGVRGFEMRWRFTGGARCTSVTTEAIVRNHAVVRFGVWSPKSLSCGMPRNPDPQMQDGWLDVQQHIAGHCRDSLHMLLSRCCRGQNGMAGRPLLYDSLHRYQDVGGCG